MDSWYKNAVALFKKKLSRNPLFYRNNKAPYLLSYIPVPKAYAVLPNYLYRILIFYMRQQ
jgi:hypothetical protein